MDIVRCFLTCFASLLITLQTSKTPMVKRLVRSLQKSSLHSWVYYNTSLASGGRPRPNNHVLCLYWWVQLCRIISGIICHLVVLQVHKYVLTIPLCKFNRCFTTNLRAHVMSVFFAGVCGFIVGCILHAIPTTASFVYNDVLALLVASLSAAILTTFWVHKSPHAPTPSKPEKETKLKMSSFKSQTRIGAELSVQHLSPSSPLPTSAMHQFISSDKSPVSRRISELLTLASEKPNFFASEATWSKSLLQTAVDRWTTGHIIVSLGNRQLFIECDVEDSWSISELENGVLNITVGFLSAPEVDAYKDRWHQALAYLYVFECGND
jgi:hypothetical protein